MVPCLAVLIAVLLVVNAAGFRLIGSRGSGRGRAWGINDVTTSTSRSCRTGKLAMAIFEGNPFGKAVWDLVWKLDVMQPGKQGVSPTSFGDAAQVLRSNILQIYGGEPSVDGAPVAEGEVEGLLEGSTFLGLRNYYNKYGSVFKLLFGPKSFIVISDPTVAKYILRDNAKAYDKGILAEILEPIMGKGLIPADPETWKVRRKAIVPGFHKVRVCARMCACVRVLR